MPSRHRIDATPYQAVSGRPKDGPRPEDCSGGIPSLVKGDTSVENPSTPATLRAGVSAAKLFSCRYQRRRKVLTEAGPERFRLGLCVVTRISLSTGQIQFKQKSWCGGNLDQLQSNDSSYGAKTSACQHDVAVTSSWVVYTVRPSACVGDQGTFLGIHCMEGGSNPCLMPADKLSCLPYIL